MHLLNDYEKFIPVYFVIFNDPHRPTEIWKLAVNGALESTTLELSATKNSETNSGSIVLCCVVLSNKQPNREQILNEY